MTSDEYSKRLERIEASLAKGFPIEVDEEEKAHRGIVAESGWLDVFATDRAVCWATMADRVLPTGTVTFLFSDMEGSTRLVQELGPAVFTEILERHNALLREAFLEMRDRGKTLVFSTHQMETVETLCTSVALIDRGRLVLGGALRDVKRASRRRAVRVGFGTVAATESLAAVAQAADDQAKPAMKDTGQITQKADTDVRGAHEDDRMTCVDDGRVDA